MTADHAADTVEMPDKAAVPKNMAFGSLRRSWQKLPRWERWGAVSALSLMMLAMIAATTMTAPPQGPDAAKPVIVEVAVGDKWEDLGTYTRTQKPAAPNVTTLEQQAAAQHEARKLAEMRAQLQVLSLPRAVEVKAPEKPKAIAAKGEAKAVAEASSLVSNKAKETIQTMEAFKLAMKEIGLSQSTTGLSAYKDQ